MTLLRRNHTRPAWSIVAGAALLAVTLAPAQTNTSWKDELKEAPTELDLFMGGQLFKKRSDPLQTKLLNATVFGLRLTENIWQRWSIEESMSGSTLADLTLLRNSGAADSNRLTLEQRLWTLSVNPVYHFTPRTWRLRPYLTGGFTEAFYTATKQGKFDAAALTPFSVPDFASQAKAGVNYGGGIKYRFTDMLGMRVDVRGITTAAPTWNLPNSLVVPGVAYIPKGGRINAMQATAGLALSFGGRRTGPTKMEIADREAKIKAEADAKAASDAKMAAERAARVLKANIGVSPSSGYTSDIFRATANVTDSANSPNLVYSWAVDGASQSGTGSSIGLPASAGTHSVTLTVKESNGSPSATADAASYTVKEVPALTVKVTADKSSIKAGESVNLRAEASQNDYEGNLTYTWKTTLGTTRGNGPTGVLDTAGAQFDPANVFKPETRTGMVSVAVTDSRGRTASSEPIPITFTKDPQAMRLDDLIYSNRSSRVNNCAKRILIDELQTIMNNNPDVQVLLVGHFDDNEATMKAKNGRVAASNLDKQRVYNAAAVMTAGTGVCAKCDLSRIMVSYAGKDQSSESKAGFCGTSSRQKSDERKSDEIAADDAAAKNRRVEIWIVPKGVSMPSTAPNPEPAPMKVIQAKGCPK